MRVAVSSRLIDLIRLLEVFQIHLYVIDIILNHIQVNWCIASDLVRVGLMLSLWYVVLQHVWQLKAHLLVLRLSLMPNQSILASILEEIQFSLILGRIVDEILALFGILKK